jgi:hypothetical protein
MGAAIDDPRPFERVLPGFLDIDAPEGRFAGKDERFLGTADFMQAMQFLDDRLAEGDAARMAVFSFFDERQLVCEVDLSPFQIEQLALARARRQGKKDDAVQIGAICFLSRRG